MSKVFRKIAIIAIAMVMLFGTLAIATGCGESSDAPIRRIEELTGVTLPNDAVILYHHIDRAFVNGRRAQYTVFEFEEKPVDFLLENNFLEGRNSDHERVLTERFGFLRLKVEDIPAKFRPCFENEYLWLEKRNVFFTYFIEQQILTVYVVGS